MTNAEKIRNMTEDELAEWIMELTGGEQCPPWHELRCMHDEDTCAGCWFRWLDTEVGA